jgi:CRISPR-associated endonuclease/helicase Cas3
VCEAAVAIWEGVEGNLAELTGTEAADLRRRLRPLFLVAALFHDIGKANSAFQAMLRATGERQPVRHEILSAMLLAKQALLSGLDLRELWFLVWAVAGHHLKMRLGGNGNSLFNPANAPREVVLHLGDPQVGGLLRQAAALLGAAGRTVQIPTGLKEQHFETVDDSEDGLESWVERFARESEKAWRPYRKDEPFQRDLALLKALLMSADAAGSALPGDNKPIQAWVRSALSSRLSEADLEPVVREGHGGSPREFQKQVAAAEAPATVVIAGCGNGKTTAAYMWGQRWARGRKLFFTYPTTGTASAGYEDYVLEQKAVTSALIHGRALVDLQAMLGSPEDDRLDDWQRLESLQAWDRQVVVCTVDTVLGLLQNQRRPIYSFPALATGAYVFDEIHSYDARLFGSLLRFLRTFPGAPVLLMSASIPPGRMEALREVLQGRVGEVIRGDPAMEGYRRYRLEPRSSATACRREVADALRLGKKVLWVCNTVADAIQEAREARKWSGLPPDKIIVYHSRFRYRDRVKRQNGVIAEFEYDHNAPGKPRKRPGGSLVISTQVCEMSLDISADLMVTAECPLPSLVQRLGRLNRYAAGDDPWPCLVYPFKGDPYNENPDWTQTRGDHRAGMTAARAAVGELAGQPCSQRDLAERLDRMSDAEHFEMYSAWLDDGWLTETAQLRDGDASVTLIRQEDLAEVAGKLGPEHAKESKWTSRSLVPWTIPMLYRRDFQPMRRAGGYPVAAEGTVAYSVEEGATWQTNTN